MENYMAEGYVSTKARGRFGLSVQSSPFELEFSHPKSTLWDLPEECQNGPLTRHF